MKNGKFHNGKSRMSIRPLALLLAVALLIGGSIGGTLAWLTAKSDIVTNTFTDSDINITLTESENLNLKMVPGWTIDKDPTVAVVDGSEDCWLFVKIKESANLDTYIAYAIASGWEAVQAENADHEIVIGRKVYKDDETKEFSVLGLGSYKDPMGTDTTEDDDVTVTWTDDQVAVKPSVTKDMMDSLTTANYPKLTFKAFAVQLMKNNTTEFTADQAWANIPESEKVIG